MFAFCSRAARQPKRTGSSLRRSATSTYTTPDAALADPSSLLSCQICLDVMRDAVALEPCGHTFCAPCLSHHLAACLRSGQPLNCPLRCAQPQRVVANLAVRALAEDLMLQEGPKRSGEANGLPPVPEMEVERPIDGDGDDGGDACQTAFASSSLHLAPFESDSTAGMDPLVPLDDASLPLEDLASLKFAQLGHTLAELASLARVGPTTEDAAGVAALESVLHCLEVVARLAWGDDEARRAVRERCGIEAIVQAMTSWVDVDAVQCGGCLALLALVRGESACSSANRWLLGVSGGLEAMLGAMRAHRPQAMVQLSALLCLVPLALEDPFFEEKIALEGLEDVLTALRMHANVEDVVAKALLAAGAVAHGSSPAAAGAADYLLKRGILKDITSLLRQYGGQSEDVLWSSMFLLGLLAREREGGGHRSRVERAVTLARSGVLRPLQRALDEYKTIVADRGGSDDPMVAEVGAHLVALLVKAEQLIWLRWARAATGVLAVWGAIVIGVRSYRRHRGGRDAGLAGR